MLKKLFFVTFLVLPFSANGAKSPVVANVGPTKITLKEFKSKYNGVKQKTINPPSPEVFLEDLVRYHVGLQEAKKRKIHQDPVYIEKMNEELYKLMVERAIGKKVEAIKVTEKEMRAFYRNNPEVRISHILIEYTAKATKKQKEIARKRAQEIYAEVKKSKRPFAELVRLYTDDTLSKNNGGDIGYQSRVTLIPTIYDEAMKMKNGQVRGLVRSRYGFHIIKLTGKRKFSQANKRQVRVSVYDNKRKKLFDRYFSKLKRKYKISKNSALVKNIK